MNRFIFDMDGTVVDTQIPFNSFVESQILQKYGINISPEELASKFAGMATKKVFKSVAVDATDADIEIMFQKKWDMMYALVETKPLKCLPGMYELIIALNRNGNQICIASAAPMLWVISCLDFAKPNNENHPFVPKLSYIFGCQYFSAEGCKNNKPNPELLLKADNSFDHANGGITYTIGDGTGDVLASIAAGFPVLYLSSNPEFDDNLLVTRFNSSLELSEYIRNKLM